MSAAVPRLTARRTVILIVALVLWFLPPPDGLTVAAWRLFVVFAAAIVSVIASAFGSSPHRCWRLPPPC